MNFYDSIIEGAQELTVQERGQLYAACLEYLYFEGRMPDFDMKPSVRALFISHKVSFDRQLARKRAGRNGGNAKQANRQRAKQTDGKPDAEGWQGPSKPPSKPPSKAIANAKQTDGKQAEEGLANGQATLWQTPTEQEQEQEVEKLPTDVGSEKSPPKRRQSRPFVPPSAEEVARVARERNLTLVDPEAFWAHYDAQGWVNGNGIPLVSWESKLISWNSAERLRQQEARREGAYDATYD